jgi:flagellar hook-associated protein 2
MEGVTLNFYGTGSSELTIGRDNEAIKEGIQTFVDAYNAYAEIIEFHGQYDTTDPTNPIPGLLQGDSMARDMIANLRRTATQQMSTTHTAANSSYSYNGAEGVMDSLQHVGIWTTGKENRLSIIDEERLDTLLQQEPEKVEQLFRGIQSETTGAREGGIALSLYNTSRDYSSDLDGWIDVRVEGIDEEIKRHETNIDRMFTAMEAKESMLWKQFNAMDEAIGAMNKDLDWLLNSLDLKKN